MLADEAGACLRSRAAASYIGIDYYRFTLAGWESASDEDFRRLTADDKPADGEG
jgi:hypothetical protein